MRVASERDFLGDALVAPRREGEIMPESDFLDALVDDLQPVRPAVPWASAMGIWILASGLFAAGAILIGGPPRPGVESDLASLRLVIELSLVFATVFAMIAAGLEIGVPGAPATRRLLTPAVVLGLLWLGIMLLGDSLPGPARSMLGKREHCLVEVLMISLPPTGLAFFLLRHRLMRIQWAAGALAGAAASALPAIGMQLACMYEPEHALRFHYSPVVLIALAGGIAGHFFLPHD